MGLHISTIVGCPGASTCLNPALDVDTDIKLQYRSPLKDILYLFSVLDLTFIGRSFDTVTLNALQTIFIALGLFRCLLRLNFLY